jgi:DNA-binding NarL/FixJ family response regulator
MSVPGVVGEEVGMNKKMIRCLIADKDLDEIANLRAMLLSCQMDVVLKIAESHTAEQAVDICRSKPADVVLMDIVFGMQGMSGLQAAALIWKEHPQTVIVIRGCHREDAIIDCLLAWKPADAELFFLPKAASEAESGSILRQALKLVARRVES